MKGVGRSATAVGILEAGQLSQAWLPQVATIGFPKGPVTQGPGTQKLLRSKDPVVPGP